MNIFFKSILLISIGLFIQMNVSSQEVQPDAVYKNLVKEYTLKPDGSWEYHYSHTLRLLTYYSFHTLHGEDFIIYNPKFQQLKVNTSTTTMLDGTIVKGPENALNELLPSFAVNAPAFNHIREMAVTHTGLEKGAVIDFDYTLLNSKDYSPGMSGNEALMMNSSVEKFTLIIHVPKGVNLNVDQYNTEVKPVIVKEGNRVTYKWNLTNLPAAPREDFRPKEQQNRPRIVFSTSKNLLKQIQSFATQSAFQHGTSEVFKARLSKLAEEKKDPVLLALAIQDIVANEINYFPVPLSAAAFRVRSAQEVYESNGGSEIEKSVLLCSMLNAVGIPSEVIAVIPALFYDNKSSNLLQAERFLVRATPGLMDPVYLSPVQNDTYNQGFNLFNKKLFHITASKPTEFKHENPAVAMAELDCALSTDEKMNVTGKANLQLSGKYNPFFKLSQDSTYTKKLLSGIVESSDVNSYTVNKLDQDHATIDYEISSNSLIQNISEHYFIQFPVLSSGIEGWHANELVSKRVEPLEIPYLTNESYHFTITLPDGFELITAEESVQVKKPFGKFSFSISQEGKTIEIHKSISLERNLISLSEYNDFRLLINSWNQKKYKECIIRKGPK
ncbi:MAG: DUF3857 domain-containing protein [Bacteroidales bacterium]|nr:DUF3857 domain-containing protein [Bacteroidales bacterium]